MEGVLNKNYKILATSGADCSVSIRNFSNILDPIIVQEFIGHSKSVNAVTTLEGRSVVSVSEDSNIHVYDLQTMERKLHFSFGYACLSVCVSTKDDKSWIFVGGSDYTIKMYAGNASFYEHLENDGLRRNIAPALVRYFYFETIT